MIDRIEELLSQMAAEEDDGQEDILALTNGRAAPAALLRRGEDEPADGAPAADGPGGPKGPPEGPGAAEETPEDGDGPALSWLEADGPAPLPPPERTPGGDGDVPAAGAAARAEPEDGFNDPAARAEGLEELYRQAARETLPPATLPAPAAVREGFGGRAAEPGSAASLAVDELDRAVRRDSRRYDGGMMIF